MTATRRYRRIAVTEWEACALLSGDMVQKRIPAALWRIPPRAGNLIWVQEPFVEWLGVGCDRDFYALGYRADAGPKGGFPPPPELLKHRQFRMAHHEASAMRAGDSRLTLAVTRCWKRERSYFEVGERAREGFRCLREASTDLTLEQAWLDHWRRAYATTAPAVLMFEFAVHRMSIAELLAERARAA